MDTANQQKILGYFLEEAKEHLQTIEQGILQLSGGSQGTETIDEMFRAAHSVKGGAAMLGYKSIQKTAHRLEDSFKVLKEENVSFDSQLEQLFLAGYDVLQDLIERLSSSTDFSDRDAYQLVRQAEPSFVRLQQHLQTLVHGGGATVAPNFAEQVKEILKQMLLLFKQQPTKENRQKLQQMGDELAKLAPEEKNWQNLVKTAQAAFANPKYSFQNLAPVVIKELKLGGDYLQAGKASQIQPSKNLQQLANTSGGQVCIPLEPKAAAMALVNNFNKQQLTLIVQMLQSKL